MGEALDEPLLVVPFRRLLLIDELRPPELFNFKPKGSLVKAEPAKLKKKNN